MRVAVDAARPACHPCSRMPLPAGRCGHDFCRRCLKNWVDSKGLAMRSCAVACPVCRGVFSESDFASVGEPLWHPGFDWAPCWATPTSAAQRTRSILASADGVGVCGTHFSGPPPLLGIAPLQACACACATPSRRFSPTKWQPGAGSWIACSRRSRGASIGCSRRSRGASSGCSRRSRGASRCPGSGRALGLALLQVGRPAPRTPRGLVWCPGWATWWEYKPSWRHAACICQRRAGNAADAPSLWDASSLQACH